MAVVMERVAVIVSVGGSVVRRREKGKNGGL